jgi:hypothetical protein
MKTNPGEVLVGGAPDTSNPGNNDATVLKLGANGKGVGNLPGYNQPYMEAASENTNPMQKHESVAGIVGN